MIDSPPSAHPATSQRARRPHPIAANASRSAALPTALAAAVLALAALAAPDPALAGGLDLLDAALLRAFPDAAPSFVPSGVLLDRVVTLANPARFDGTPNAPAASPAVVRQLVHELRRASWSPPAPDSPASTTPDALRERSRLHVDGTPIPLAVVRARAARLRDDAGARQRLARRAAGGRIPLQPSDVEEVRIFAAAPLVDSTRRGASVSFVAERGLWMSWGLPEPARLALDLDDGRGFRDAAFGAPLAPAWSAPGRRRLQVRAEWPNGDVRVAHCDFEVAARGTPAPNDTLEIVATVPFGGAAGSGRAYVALAPGHTSIVNPVVVVEGFDLDDSMSWEKLYELLNQENLLEELRSLGFDAVVLDFDSATYPIQRNAFVVAELLQQVGAAIDPAQDIFLVGASMGGLCARYALAWMESQSLDARVRTFLSFDSPHAGANVPLGVQYWLDFFASESADVAFLLSRLDTPAARQMLLAHHTTPPGPTGSPDPLRGALLADFAALGDWPAAPRLAAVANGSGSAQGQGFASGSQIIEWEYRNILVDIDGDVWAVPNPGSGVIFHGRIDFIFLPADEQTVSVSGTPPLDDAPGGSRDSMFQMDTTAAPYGDIVALHDRHCFVPTMSALALDVADLYFDAGADPDPLALTPFDAVLWASANEEHVFVSPETKAWILSEVTADAMSAPIEAQAAPAGALRFAGAFPQPARGAATIRFVLRDAGAVDAEVLDVAGRRVARILEGAALPAGTHTVRWNPPAAGVYFVRLRAAGEEAIGRVAAVR